MGIGVSGLVSESGMELYKIVYETIWRYADKFNNNKVERESCE